MKVNPNDLATLLEIQNNDKAVDALKHKASVLPIHLTVNELTARRTQVGNELIAARTQLSDATVAAQRAEDDVVPVRERLERNQARVDAGAMDAKALGTALDEIGHLKARIATLEDVQLEAMETLESANAQVETLAEDAEEADRELREAVAGRDAQVGDLAAQAKALKDARASLVPSVAPDLLALYEKIRARSGGVGIAPLVGKRCQGCGIEVTVTDFNRYQAAPADELLRCAECDRILVR